MIETQHVIVQDRVLTDELFHFVNFTTNRWLSGETEPPENVLLWLFTTKKSTKVKVGGVSVINRRAFSISRRALAPVVSRPVETTSQLNGS